MILRWLLLVGGCLLNCWPGTVCAMDQPATPEALLRQSGLVAQLEYLPAVLGEGFAQAVRQTDERDAARIAQLEQEAAVAFALEPMLVTARAEIAAGLTEQDRQDLLDWLDSPLGQKVTQAETAAAAPDVQAYIAALASRLNPAHLNQKRVELLLRLDKALSYSAHSLDVMLEGQTVITVALARSSGRRIDPAQVRARLARQRLQLAESLRPQLFATLYVTYLPLSDRELQQYILFAYTDQGRRFLDVSGRVMTRALRSTMQRF